MEKYYYSSKFKWFKMISGLIIIPSFLVLFSLLFFMIFKKVLEDIPDAHLVEIIVYGSLILTMLVNVLIVIYAIFFAVLTQLISIKINQEGIKFRNFFSQNAHSYSWNQLIGYTLTEVQGRFRSDFLIVIYCFDGKKIVLYGNWYIKFDILVTHIKKNVPLTFGEEKNIKLILMGLKSFPNRTEKNR